MDALQEYGILLILAFQQFSPALDGLMHFFTFLGKIEFYLIIIPFIYWAVDKRLGIRMLLLLIATDLISATLKLIFHQPRPYWLGRVVPLAEETTYGIPSSHSSEPLAVWGYLAYRLNRRWLWMVVVAFVAFIGISRLYLGVHFPHDVLIGWLIGAFVLWAFIMSEDRLAAWFNRLGLRSQLGFGFLLSLAVISVGQLVQLWLTGITDPPAWAAFAAQARNASYSFTQAGALFGALSGYVLMKQYKPFESAGSWMKRLGRYVLGITGLLLVYNGLDVVFASITPDETLLGYVLRYLRYATVTFLVTFLAPWLFVRIGLADRQTALPPGNTSQPARSQHPL